MYIWRPRALGWLAGWLAENPIHMHACSPIDVEEVLDSRILVNGNLEYFVKWQKCSAAKNSWEPFDADDPQYCAKVRAFEFRRRDEDEDVDGDGTCHDSSRVSAMPTARAMQCTLTCLRMVYMALMRSSSWTSMFMVMLYTNIDMHALQPPMVA